ncbi:GH3 auxin-responsive promoter family protein [Kordia zhangzhouensis]|uniref:GH3 auxin-responsive promoter family protein n=1 Tax=Kordia zhangzhouensis TaxID=1620405 RepID=UPI000629BE2A|nr:GH3 auxin-responsive promoter family protein [Kordia zhangzhouensis]
MPIPLVNSIASWFLKKRFSQIEHFLKNPNEVQLELLMSLLQTAKRTEIGIQHDFASITDYKTFSERVPVVTYEDIQAMVERARRGESNIFWPKPIRWFAKSSGTTNAKSKFIPVSSDSLELCHYAASKDLLCLYLNNNENAQLFNGKNLRLGGSKELYEQNGTYYGDLSAILIDNMPLWAEFSSTPSNKVSLMGDWEVKIDAIIKETLRENVTSLAGVPSWMLVLLNEVLEQTQKAHLFEVWENLEVYFHGGVSFAPYEEQYRNILPKTDFRYYEIYNASEGFFAIQDQNDSDELLLMLDYGIFYEFIPMETFHTANQKVIPLSEVEADKNYAVVITTNAGLWRYMIGDTVRFTSISPYRVKITGRTKHHINVFGEELIIENAEAALKKVCAATKSKIVEYTAGPIFMHDREKGAHEWIIEFNKAPDNIDEFAFLLDEALQNINSDYEAKRFNNITLNRLKLHVARPKLFYDWLKKKDKLGGQHKIPRLSSQRTYLDELLKMNQK